MSTTRTTHGLQWVVSVAIAAVSVLTPPGMLLFSFLVAVFQLSLELTFGLNLSVVSILLSVCILVLIARVATFLLMRN